MALAPVGLRPARRAQAAIAGSEIHGFARRVLDANVTFDNPGEHLRSLFAAGTCRVIGVCAATGILIRLLAPHLPDKTSEPAVIAVAEDGSAVVPLLGGHRGANDLASEIAAAFGVVASVTTAGDVRFGAALDNPPDGWTLANPDDMKPFTAALLAGEAVRLDDTLPDWVADTDIPRDLGGTLRITATPTRNAGDTRHLVYHPASVAIGVGCERGADPDEVAGLVDAAVVQADIAPPRLPVCFRIGPQGG